MILIKNILEKKIVSYPLIFFIFISCIGLFNSSWYSLIIYQILFLLFFSAKINFNKKYWLIVAFLVPITIFTKQNLEIPKIIQGSNVFIGGENYNDSIFKEKLPKKIYNKLNTDFKKIFPNSISGPDIKLYHKSVSQIFFKSPETKFVENIYWNNRYQLQLGAFNNTKYNAYGDQEPKRTNLPFFVKYSFPSDYSKKNAKFCWEGTAYIGKELVKTEFTNMECINFNTIKINSKDLYDIWLLETGNTIPLKAKLVLPFKYKIAYYLKHIISILSCLLILAIIFNKINYRKFSMYIISVLISLALSFYFYPNLINKFIIFEGGNDGLLYVHFAHLISDFLSVKDFKGAFMGGEEAYDLMPFYRYVWVINFILFEESPWMLIFILTFFPIVIYKIFTEILGKKIAKYFLIFWFFIPIFEAFGFCHFYYVKLAIRGFGEPLSYLCFLSALLFLIKFNKNSNYLNYSNSFIFGLLLALSIGLRANILPACLVLIVFYLILAYKINYKAFLFLCIGFSLVLIMPIHNYVFTNKFIPLTIAAYKDWNLGARPSDYFILFKSLLTFSLNLAVLEKIINHVHGEIKLYEIWYHFAIAISIFYAIKRQSPFIIRCLAISSISLISLLLFYHVGGRYSYLSWTLSLIVLSYWFKANFLPYIKKNTKLNAA